MARKSFKAGALTAPLPPVMVTVGDMKEHNVLTIGWTGILSTIPPRTYISVRPERYSYSLLKRTNEFVINLTTAEQARTVDYVGVYTGAKVNKFKECNLTAIESKEVSAPTVKECPFALECRVIEVIPMGSHDVFIADIVSVSCDEGMIDGDGRIRFDTAGLLAYAHGEYFALGKKIGKFGFSAKKGKKASAKNGKLQGEKNASQFKTAAKDYSARPNVRDEKRNIKGDELKNKKPTSSADNESKRPFYLDAPRKKRKNTFRKNTGKKK